MEAKENLDEVIEEITSPTPTTEIKQEATETVEVKTPEANIQEVVEETVEAPIETPASQPVMTTKKSNKGMAFCMALLAILAVAGICFGVWTMMDKDQQVKTLNDQITTLRAQNNELQEQIIDLQDEANTPEEEVVKEEIDCVATPDAEGCVEEVVEGETTDDTTDTTDDTITE